MTRKELIQLLEERSGQLLRAETNYENALRSLQELKDLAKSSADRVLELQREVRQKNDAAMMARGPFRNLCERLISLRFQIDDLNFPKGHEEELKRLEQTVAEMRRNIAAVLESGVLGADSTSMTMFAIAAMGIAALGPLMYLMTKPK